MCKNSKKSIVILQKFIDICISDTLWIFSDGTTGIYGSKPKTDKNGNLIKDKNNQNIDIIDYTKPGQWNTFIGSE